MPSLMTPSLPWDPSTLMVSETDRRSPRPNCLQYALATGQGCCEDRGRLPVIPVVVVAVGCDQSWGSFGAVVVVVCLRVLCVSDNLSICVCGTCVVCVWMDGCSSPPHQSMAIIRVVVYQECRGFVGGPPPPGCQWAHPPSMPHGWPTNIVYHGIPKPTGLKVIVVEVVVSHQS